LVPLSRISSAICCDTTCSCSAASGLALGVESVAQGDRKVLWRVLQARAHEKD
jgi:hypothetical protein